MLAAGSFTPRDLRATLAIVEHLPEHFTADAPRRVGTPSPSTHGWVVVERDDLVGFSARRAATRSSGRDPWMAIDPPRWDFGTAHSYWITFSRCSWRMA
jgi:hypothetical protein